MGVVSNKQILLAFTAILITLVEINLKMFYYIALGFL